MKFKLVIYTSLTIIRFLLGLVTYWEIIEFKHYVLFIHPPILLLSYFVIYKGVKERYKIFVLAALVVDLVLPLYGIINIVLFSFFYILFSKFTVRADSDVYDWSTSNPEIKEFIEAKHILIEKDLNKSLEEEMHESLQVRAYIDILETDDIPLKLSVIEKLSSQVGSRSVFLLTMALDDDDYEIRYFANNALNKIEESLMRKIEDEDKNLKNSSNDYKNYNSRGNSYLHLYSSGLLNTESKKHFLELAHNDYLVSLQLMPAQHDIILKIVQIHLLTENYEGVLDIIDSANVNEKQAVARLQFYRMEANFYLKRFNQVQEDANKIKQSGSENKIISDLSKWWASG